MTTSTKNNISFDAVKKAQINIKGVVKSTPLILMDNFSEIYEANISFKREEIAHKKNTVRINNGK